MFGINLKHSLAIVAVAAGVLSAAGSASAAGVSDGTSNTIMFGERAVFSGDAYDNETGLRAARLLPDVDDQVL